MSATLRLAATDEQKELRATVRDLMRARSGPAAVRRIIDGGEGFDRDLWRQVSEMGLPAILVPERFGGLGLGAAESAAVLEEMGAVLYPGPYLAVTIATIALLASGDEAAGADLLPGIADGSVIATLAAAGSDGSWQSPPTVTAAETGEGWKLDGDAPFVLDGQSAGLILVRATTPAGRGLFAVSSGAPGVEAAPLTSLDLTRQVARVTLRQASGRLLGEPGGAGSVLAATLDRAVVALAADSCGGAAECLRLSVDYAKERVQFGVPIGSFQAVAHRCADMLQRVEFTRAAVQYAAAAADAGSDEFPLAARVAAAYASRAYSWVTTETIQVHGGLGFTWEHDAHLYYRRSRSSEQMLGNPQRHWEAIAERAGL